MSMLPPMLYVTLFTKASRLTHNVSLACSGWICVCDPSACYYVLFPAHKLISVGQSQVRQAQSFCVWFGSSHLFRASLQLHAAVSVQVCSCCRLTKPSTEFYTNKTAADMLHSLCKTCHGDKCRSRASGNYEVSVVDKVHHSALRWPAVSP